MDTAERTLLRHVVATIAYRGRKAVLEAPETFGTFRAAESSRTPLDILAHIGDLFDWALSLARGRQVWKDSAPHPWPLEIDRFFEALSRFDAFLASDEEVSAAPERLFQGPLADALTHVGQIAMLRRLAGVPIRGENYYAAEIVVGRAGREQAAPRREF